VTPAVLTFDTTHHALWAEEIALSSGLGAQVVPAPAASQAKCGLALEVLPEELEVLRVALDRAGVAYQLYEG
jgi:hypothetical protein